MLRRPRKREAGSAHRCSAHPAWPPLSLASGWRRGGEKITFAEQFTRDHDLGFADRDSEGEAISLRELLVHMIEEYARRNGHADLLRERIDGAVGD